MSDPLNTVAGARSHFFRLLLGLALGVLAACGPPEVRACEAFVDHLRACTDRNAPASGDGEDEPEATCAAVDPACAAYFECAADQPCVASDAGFYSVSVDACAPPEGIDCP